MVAGASSRNIPELCLDLAKAGCKLIAPSRRIDALINNAGVRDLNLKLKLLHLKIQIATYIPKTFSYYTSVCNSTKLSYSQFQSYFSIILFLLFYLFYLKKRASNIYPRSPARAHLHLSTFNQASTRET